MHRTRGSRISIPLEGSNPPKWEAALVSRPDTSQRCHSQEESKIRRSSSAPFDLKAKRRYDIPGRRERLLSCGHSSFASKILRQSPCDPGFRQGDLHPSAARRLLVLQARQQPCTSAMELKPRHQFVDLLHDGLASRRELAKA